MQGFLRVGVNPQYPSRMRALWSVGINMTPKNFVSDLLEPRLTEAQPRTIKVGRTYQGNSSAPSRVPFIRLAGNWLAEAGFSEGDEVQVSVAPGEIRLRRQGSSHGSEESRRPDDVAARWAHEESGHAHGGCHARPMVTPKSFWAFLSSPRHTGPHVFNRAIRMT